ncbi:MAG: valine--tRNA ligase [Desulfatibacillaceae bacterium]
MDSQLDKGYEPKDVEARWYAFWEKEGLFRAEETSDKPPYSIVIPPPNVTGVLHMGHALNNTLQDILCRYRRLKGDNVLWMPGTDHAGIATQNVVEKQLAAEGTDRHAVGRERFMERVWEWREKYGGAIINQLKRLGASCDWERERFTMDEGLSTAVRKVFVELYEQGLIYQGDYIINWCPRCHTALADLEVEHDDVPGHLYHIEYPFAEGSGGVVVATTRPETMLGDTAVAVNPEDERYENLPADSVILPLMERKIPIIRDGYVDMEFGTGCLKITPAHDPNDFEIGTRHGLDMPKVIGDDGRMTAEAGPYEGLDRFEARKRIVEDLEARGLLKKQVEHPHGVGHCYRCKTTVEPNLSKQWFVKVKPLADKAIQAVEDGRTRIIPEHWARTYYDWMYNIRDWCISRQIWWGHRIPAWTCGDCGEIMVAMKDPDKCARCGGADLSRDTDVLDTWFSSALWPFSTMGWPEETDLLKTFYPTSCLVTGFDILFFWVARMMMMGLWFKDEVPFHDVYIHALVRDADGKKMSKSKGNVIDPLEVIDEYGCDAFRFTLAAFAAMGRDIKLSTDRIQGYRHFINKLWNAARFTMGHIQGHEPAPSPGAPGLVVNRWILSRLSTVVREVDRDLTEYRFNDAANGLYQFVWHEFCDWYLEAAKPNLYGDDPERKEETKNTLGRVFKDIVILLHPFVPFVTEELWHRLPHTQGSVMRAEYPAAEDRVAGVMPDEQAEREMRLVMDMVSAIRNVRSEMNLPPSAWLDVMVRPPENTPVDASAHTDLVKSLARLASIEVGTGDRPRGAATTVVQEHTVYVLLEGVVDLDKEAGRLEKEIAKVDKELVRVEKKLSNEDFLAKAPPDVVEKVRAQQQDLTEKRERLNTNLEKVREIHAGN